MGFKSDWRHPSKNTTEHVAVVGSGNNWGDVLQGAYSVGRTVVSGQDPTVGLGGFIGGGGHGPLSSHYGLAADQVLQATVVTTDGRILVANPTQNQDLL
jgi:FAD/FMN-containing dehydrogenase